MLEVREVWKNLVAGRSHAHDSTPSTGCSAGVRSPTRPLVAAGVIIHSNVNDKEFKCPRLEGVACIRVLALFGLNRDAEFDWVGLEKD